MRALERSIKGHLEVILNLFRSIVVAYFLYQTCTIFMVHWYILLIYIINVPYFYGTSVDERSIKGHLEVILNLFRSIGGALFLYHTCTTIVVHVVHTFDCTTLCGTFNSPMRGQLQGHVT